MTGEAAACIKISKRRKRRIRKPGNIYCHVPCSAQHRAANGSTYIDMQSKLAIQLLKCRNKLADKIHRATGETSFRGNWRLFGHLSSSRNLRNVEGDACA